MRKRFPMLAGILLTCTLCACSTQAYNNNDHQEPEVSAADSASVESDASETTSIPTTSDSVSSKEAPSDSQVPAESTPLTRYDSIYDVPYAKLDYKSFADEGDEEGRYALTKDGMPWVGTPGTDQFGEICFSDGHNFYIQCYLSYNDTLSSDFRWFCVNFDHFDEEDPIFLPDETMNQQFIGANGDTLYTADGYEYTVHTMPWCQDGTCKR